MLPSAARATSAIASSVMFTFSVSAIRRSRSTIARVPIVRSSNTCARDRIVVGNLVQLGRRHHEDDVRRRLLHRLEEGVERRRGELVHFVDDEDLVAIAGGPHLQPADDHLTDVVDAGVRRGVDLEHVEVAALGDLDAGVADAARVGVGPFSQLSARARMRAVVVLPTPRAPANRKAWATRPVAMALRRVWVTPFCPTTSSKRCGRHLRARTWYDSSDQRSVGGSVGATPESSGADCRDDSGVVLLASRAALPRPG